MWYFYSKNIRTKENISSSISEIWLDGLNYLKEKCEMQLLVYTQIVHKL